MLLARRDETHEEPSLRAEFATLCKAPDFYIALLVLLAGLLAPEAPSRLGLGLELGLAEGDGDSLGVGLESASHLNMATAQPRQVVPQHQRGAPLNSSGLLSNAYLDDAHQACPMWLLGVLCFVLPCVDTRAVPQPGRTHAVSAPGLPGTLPCAGPARGTLASRAPGARAVRAAHLGPQQVLPCAVLVALAVLAPVRGAVRAHVVSFLWAVGLQAGRAGYNCKIAA